MNDTVTPYLANDEPINEANNEVNDEELGKIVSTSICPICYEIVDRVHQDVAKSAKCDHPNDSIHYACLRNWLKIKRECPLCRTSIGPEDLYKNSVRVSLTPPPNESSPLLINNTRINDTSINDTRANDHGFVVMIFMIIIYLIMVTIFFK